MIKDGWQSARPPSAPSSSLLLWLVGRSLWCLDATTPTKAGVSNVNSGRGELSACCAAAGVPSSVGCPRAGRRFGR
jgi:hypothetical protein